MRAFHQTILAGGDGCFHMPPAIDTITSQGTAIALSLAATTIAAGDSFQIKNAAPNSDCFMLSFWAHNQVAGMARIRTPKMHDNVDSIRTRTQAALVFPLMAEGTAQRFYPQDVEIVELAGSTTAGKIEGVTQLMYYSDLPGQAARLITADTLKQRMKNQIGVRLAITLGTTTGYNGARAINGDVDLLKANTDYALLGASGDVRTQAICLRGPDTGNLRVSLPCEPTLWHLTESWFVRLSRLFGLALIPVINSANKGGTLVDCVNNDAGGTENVTLWLAELGT
jgi:hypothetical protein